MSFVSGLILLDKPPGITSFRLLGSLKRRLGTAKVGHTGTLDPFASGLLPVLAERATRFASLFASLSKTYEARIEFGVETDTLDPEGVPAFHAPVPLLADIERSIPRFIGKIEQVPPAFSAVHIDGKRAYALARQGIEPELKPRPVTIEEITILAWETPFLRAQISCSSGTYIRSLARDMGIACGSRAYLSDLRRISVGPFDVRNAVSPEAFDPDKDLIPVSAFLPLFPGIARITIPESLAPGLIHGKPLDPGLFPDMTEEGVRIGVYDTRGNLLALVEKRDSRYRYLVVFGADP